MRLQWLCLLFVLTTCGWPLSSSGQTTRAVRPATQPANWPFEFSKETTVVNGPVRKDGTVDYVIAINERLAQGVTRDNNAAIGMIEVITRNGKAGRTEHYAAVREKLGAPGAVPAPAKAAAGGDAADANLPDDFAAAPPGMMDQTMGRPWVAGDAPEMAKWLEAAAPQLDLLVEASKRDRYYMPLIRPREEESMVGILLPHLNEIRTWTNALKSRAMLRLGNEDIEGFRRDAVAVVRLGRLLGAAPIMIEKLVAAGIETAGLDSIKTAATGGWLSEVQVQSILGDLRAAPAPSPLYEVFDLGERGFMLEFIQFAAVHGVGEAEKQLQMMTRPTNANNRIQFPALPVIGKDWNAALKKVNAWYDRLMEAGKKATYVERKQAAQEIERDLAGLRAQQTGLNAVLAPIEDRAMVMLMSAASRAYLTETRLIAHRQLTEIALALSAFRSGTQEYPEELRQLVPTFFKEEPLDAFTAKPLIYRTQGKGYILQSVGDAGAGRRQPMNELTVEVGR